MMSWGAPVLGRSNLRISRRSRYSRNRLNLAAPEDGRTPGSSAPLWFHCEIGTDQLFVIPRKYAAIREGWMGPDYRPAAVLVRRLEQVRPADFFVGTRAELRDDQVSFFVEQKKTAAVFDNERVRPTHRFTARCRCECFPN